MTDTGRQRFTRNRRIIERSLFVYKLLPATVRSFLIWALSGSNASPALGLRYLELAATAKQCGGPVYLAKWTVLKSPSLIEIGSNVSIHEYCYLDASGGLRIGNNVSIANHVSVISFEHTWGDTSTPIKYNPTRLGGVEIGDDVWIGCGVRILADAVIPGRTIIAAGAVVKGELEGGFIYGGIPARKIRALDDD